MEGAREEQNLNARRLREVLKGRINQEQALRLLEEFGDPEPALDFVLNSDPGDVRHYLQSDPAHIQDLSREAEALADDLNRGVENEIRQFACKDCLRSWWRRVPVRKKVSKCRRCHQRYKCIPRDKEWGTGDYRCENCGNQFFGFAVMGETRRVCHICRALVFADHINPPRRGERQERRPDHFRFQIIGRHIRWASQRHESTGSTVTTFMTGGSFETASVSERAPLLDIPEESGDSSGDEN